MIRKGDIVAIVPEWQDPGDSLYEWIALENQFGGRVRIMPMFTGFVFPAHQILPVQMVQVVHTVQRHCRGGEL